MTARQLKDFLLSMARQLAQLDEDESPEAMAKRLANWPIRIPGHDGKRRLVRKRPRPASGT